MICISIAAQTLNKAIEEIKEIEKINDINLGFIELRLDYIKDVNKNNLNKLFNNIKSKKKLIVTCRRFDQGGFKKIPEAERVELLEQSMKLGTDYVDIELGSKIKRIGKTKIIISHHNFKETPDNVEEIFYKIKKQNPDIIKIATFANSYSDNLKLLNLPNGNKRVKKIIIAMGEKGIVSRVHYKKFGSILTYASYKKKSAPGQIDFRELSEIYNVEKICNKTKLFCLIGNPVEHSLSHAIMNDNFRKLKFDGVYFKCRVNDLNDFMHFFRKMDISGASVTIPYKQEIIKYLDCVEPLAKKIGAVNTIVNKNKRLIGYNTDCIGAIKALEENTTIKNKKVAILGAGGAARAIAFGVKKKKGNVIILNRTKLKAKCLAREFGGQFGTLNDIKKFRFDILINTTPIGMYPNVNNSPLAEDAFKHFRNKCIVMDAVYNPRNTKLLKSAKKFVKQSKVISGIKMFEYQAQEQIRLWTEKSVSVKV